MALALSLAACGGGGGSSAPGSTPVAPVNPPTIPQGNLVAPQFHIVVPARGTTAGKRKPQYVSSATGSITITLTSVAGGPPTGISPLTVTTALADCSSGCTVSGPPSPPGVADAYSLSTFVSSDGSGLALDEGSTTFSPVVGTANSPSVTLDGVPHTVSITGISSSFLADNPSQSASFNVVVEDASSEIITGSYSTPVLVQDPDTLSYGSSITGTHTVACSGSCVSMTSDSDTISLDYDGLAENPVTITPSNSDADANGGTENAATFTPGLHAIAYDGGATSALGGAGIDLYTSDSAAGFSGYEGFEEYYELGYTNSPYDQNLAVTGTSGCSSFATLGTSTDISDTEFTATAIASPTAGQCTLTVTDNVTANNRPTFVVTYSSSSIGVNAGHRRPPSR